MSDGNAKMSHIKSEQGGSVVCRLQSHWLYYVLCGLALALAVSEFLSWLNPEGAGRHLLNAVLALALAVYLFLSAKNQQVVFTDSRVVCRGGRLPFAERTLVPSEIRLWQSPVLKMLQSDLYNVQLIDGKRKYSYPWLSISGERLAFLNDRYRVEIKNDWRGMFG